MPAYNPSDLASLGHLPLHKGGLGEAIRPYHYFSLPVEEISCRTVVALSYTISPGLTAQGLARQPVSGGLSAYGFQDLQQIRQACLCRMCRKEESHL